MSKRLCALRIGVDYYLLAEAQALRVFSALRGAQRVDLDYAVRHERRWRKRERDALDQVELIAVEADAVIEPARSRPLMIEDKR